MRIALIEDNIDLARSIAHSLGDKGHAVDHIADDSDADRYLAREGADAIILDINLPGQSELEVLRAWRRREDPTPVLLLTARSDTADRVAGLDAGADDYLVKPFAMEELPARLRALLRRRRSDVTQTGDLGPLTFHRSDRQFTLDGAPLDLPRWNACWNGAGG